MTFHSSEESQKERVIFVSVRDYFGRVTIRPECETARLFCELLKQKNLTEVNCEVIKKLGYEIKTKEVRL